MILPFLKRKLSNHLTVLYRHTPKNLMAEIQLIFPGGQLREPAALGGLSNFTMELAVKGTQKRSYRELCEVIESLGGSIWGDDAQDYGSLNLSVPAEEAERALPLFAEVVLESAFPTEEIEKEKKATLAEIKSKEEHPFTIAYERLNGLLFGDHAYGKPGLGTRETVGRISRNDILRWKETWLKPDQAVLSIAAPLAPDRTLKSLKALLGNSWGRQGPQLPAAKPLKALRQEKRVKLEKRFQQAYLLIGFRAPGLSSPLYPQTKILNALLGGGMSARLFQEIREKRGLAYDVGSFYPTRLLASSFVIHVGLQPPKIKKAEACVHKLLEDLKTTAPKREQVEEAKRYIRGTYFMDHQTNSRKAFYMGWWEILGKGAAYDSRYAEEIERVTPESVKEAAQEIFEQPPQIVELHPN